MSAATAVVLISGGGTNLQSIIDASQRGDIGLDIGLDIAADTARESAPRPGERTPGVVVDAAPQVAVTGPGPAGA